MNGGGGAWGVVVEDISGHREFKPIGFSQGKSSDFPHFHPPRILEFASFCRRRLCEAHQLARW